MKEISAPFIRRRRCGISKGPRGDFCGGHRQSVLFDRTRGRRCGDGNKGGRDPEGTRVTGFMTPIRRKFPMQSFFAAISYREVLSQNLKVMDRTAISLCNGHGIPSWCST